jgi:hypothetical protein
VQNFLFRVVSQLLKIIFSDQACKTE